MIPITDSRIEEYLMGLAPEDNPSLLAMESRAKALGFPIVDRLVGRFLYILTRIKQPRLVVELGSGFGYSAWWFARAISITGKVVMTDYSPTNIAYAREMFQESGLSDRVEFRVGDALNIGRDYRDIDILFIDLDKHQYREAMEAMIPHLAPHALVIADNVLWYGKVVEGEDDPETRGIRDFNDFMTGRKDFFTSILPLRDGVMVAYRLS
ncbi:O-methyltransferase family 3 [Geobacter metallireducens RCH3]|uniref:SAM-dependent methyltransferase, putative n=1 Tax=Geobacter metallireducens (strain ATCC 53774 / DSM 7210 / GS-15) TaxID=269799 RepID=Q39RD1_GEOMG|nr:O-methyltransferase [Geobacter metallireducens]ABB33193.1 SAM-dependent methyltransferase, putative [Geobacter metallireducens GS-15]EHP84406.1 O-methyltransferase family 3 [Geobacter metallireducens RCH3]